MKWFIPLVLVLIAAVPCFGAEFTALGGGLWGSETPDSSFTWQLDYRQELGGPFAASLTWLNEGHIPDHHRDGQALQFWGHTRWDRRFSVAAGVGPYFYYDTTPDPTGNLMRDDHGWGTLVSLAGTWQTDSPWLFQLRSNWVVAHGVDTYGALFGVGYRFDRPEQGRSSGASEEKSTLTTHREVAVLVGPTTVNNAGNPHSTGMEVEYRRGLLRNLDWTAALLYEGSNMMTRRYGLASQLWLVRAFLGDTMALGFGGGPYLAIDELRAASQGGGDPLVAALVTLSGSYRLHANWGMRFSWNRVVTSYDRDADLWLGGLAYRF